MQIEKALWTAADKMRGAMDPGEYKHVALGLLFLRYVSVAFDAIHHHLSATGVAGVVLANGSMSSMQSGEGDIRRAMVQGDAVDAMVALPGQLFFGTQIPACLWILAKDKSNGVAKDAKLRDRRGAVLFIDARKMGALIPGSRKQKELSEAEIARIATAYHAWRGEPDAGA